MTGQRAQRPQKAAATPPVPPIEPAAVGERPPAVRLDLRRGLLLAAAAFACWGLLSPGNKILLEEFGPLWVQAVRTVLATLVIALVLRRGDLGHVHRLARMPGVLLLAFVGQALAFTFFILSQRRIEATFTTLGFFTAPVWTAVLARGVLGERLGRGFAPAVAGLLVGGWMALGAPRAGGLLDVVGVSLAVLSGMAWAGYAVLLRRHGHLPFRPLLFVSVALGMVWFVALALLFEPMPDWGGISARGWRWTFLQLAVPTLAALALYQGALRFAPAAAVNLLVGLELAGTVLFSWLLLGDAFTAVQAVGLVVVLAAVTLYLGLQAKQEIPPEVLEQALKTD